MKNITEEAINNAVNNCCWLSENNGINQIKGICTGMCMPCQRVIEANRCVTIKELQEDNKQ